MHEETPESNNYKHSTTFFHSYKTCTFTKGASCSCIFKEILTWYIEFLIQFTINECYAYARMVTVNKEICTNGNWKSFGLQNGRKYAYAWIKASYSALRSMNNALIQTEIHPYDTWCSNMWYHSKRLYIFQNLKDSFCIAPEQVM